MDDACVQAKFGRTAVEAGALERPIIVTRVGAVGETVLAEPDCAPNQRTGWKVEPGNADDLANALRQCINLTPSQRRTIGKRARKFGQNRFSLDQMCDKTVAIYEELLGKQA